MTRGGTGRTGAGVAPCAETSTGHVRGTTAGNAGRRSDRGIGSEREVSVATRSIVCPECGAEVPAGRLSCAACGTLIASVAGSTRRSANAGPAADDPNAPLGDALDAVAASAQHARDLTAWTTGMDAAEDLPNAAAQVGARPTAAPPPTPPVLKDWTGPMPVGVVTPPAGAAPIPPLPTWTPPAWTAPEPAPAPVSSAAEPAAGAVSPDESWDSGPADDELVHVHEHDRVAGAMPTPDLSAEPSWPPSASVPGAYVAPAIVPTAAATIKGHPATATSIAAAAVADGTLTSIPAAPRPDRWYSVPGPAKDASSAPGKAGLFSDLPFRTPRDLPAWMAAIGSLIGAIGFVLPFSSSLVIGGGIEDTLTGRWGLSNPANLVVMVLSIALLFVTLIPSRIPVSIRGAVLPILLGGWFLGILWSYATGPFGLGVGVDALGVAGVVLIIGGALAAARADDPPKAAREADAA
jgi:hypothetical protein